MTEISFAAEVRSAIRDGIYQPKSKLDLVLLASLAEKHAGTALGAAICEILAFAIEIDRGTAYGMKGGAFLDSVTSMVRRINPFTNPIFVRFPTGHHALDLAQILGFTREVVAAH